MIKEMTAEQLENECPTFVEIVTQKQEIAKAILMRNYSRVETDENGAIRVYDAECPEDVVTLLYKDGIIVSEIKTTKISLEEYYINLMHGKEVK